MPVDWTKKVPVPVESVLVHVCVAPGMPERVAWALIICRGGGGAGRQASDGRRARDAAATRRAPSPDRPKLFAESLIGGSRGAGIVEGRASPTLDPRPAPRRRRGRALGLPPRSGARGSGVLRRRPRRGAPVAAERRAPRRSRAQRLRSSASARGRARAWFSKRRGGCLLARRRDHRVARGGARRGPAGGAVAPAPPAPA